MTVRPGSIGTNVAGSVRAEVDQGMIARATLQGEGSVTFPGGLLTSNQGRPDADDSDGTWTNEAGGAILYPSIDEQAASDADYIQSDLRSGADICRVRLSDPASTGTSAKLNIRYEKVGTPATHLTVILKQGTTAIATWEYFNISTSFVTAVETLTAAQYAAISDFNDLFLEFRADQAALDLKFTTGEYWNRVTGAIAVTDVLSCSRASEAYTPNADGTLTLFSSNVLRITNLGLMIEGQRTNDVLWNRDLTNAVWTPTNVTAAKNQTGVDGGSNAASSIAATAGNGTILQAITLASSGRWQSAYVKRLVGAGTIQMTMDNGATWTTVTVTSDWTRVEIPTQTLANPTVGFRIVTSGDSIAVDFVQNENTSTGSFATSAIATTTTAITRSADLLTFTGHLADVSNSLQSSMVVDVKFNTGGVYPPGAFTRVVFSSPLTFFLFAFGQTDIIAVSAGPLFAALTNTHGGSIMAGLKIASAFDATGRSLTANGAACVSDAVGSPNMSSTYQFRDTSNFENFSYRRLTLWNMRLADATLQSLTEP